MCAGSRPEAQEVLTATRFGDHQVALKSGYDKYVSVEKSGRLTARADAISSQELWQAVFQDVRVTLVKSYIPHLSLLSTLLFVQCCLYVPSLSRALQGKTALLGSNNCFLSVSDSGEIRCSSLKVGEHEVLTVSSSAGVFTQRGNLHAHESDLQSVGQRAVRLHLHLSSFLFIYHFSSRYSCNMYVG